MKTFFSYLKEIKIYTLRKDFFTITFYTLWSVFLLYNSEFLYPLSMWLYFSLLSLFLVPIFFNIGLNEEKLFLKILYIFVLISSIILSFYIVNLKGVKRDIGKNEFINGMLIIYFFFFILYFYLNRKFSLKNFNISFKDKRNSFILIIVSIMIITPIIFIVSRNPQFKSVYPLFKIMKNSKYDFIRYEFAFLYFFFFWEFYFRGIMLKSFKDVFKDDFVAIILQSLIFTFLHFGKPGLETLSSFFGGFILGFFSLKLNSIFPAFFLHFYISFLMDILSIYF
ncbi:MAG: CPBP family glutamic-type intramembrane protease [candidate division WOR-3 bacterium]